MVLKFHTILVINGAQFILYTNNPLGAECNCTILDGKPEDYSSTTPRFGADNFIENKASGFEGNGDYQIRKVP